MNLNAKEVSQTDEELVTMAWSVADKLTDRQREALRHLIVSCGTPLRRPLGSIQRRFLTSLCRAHRLMGPPLPTKPKTDNALMFSGDGYSSKATAGTAYAERILANRPKAPPGRMSA